MMCRECGVDAAKDVNGYTVCLEHAKAVARTHAMKMKITQVITGEVAMWALCSDGRVRKLIAAGNELICASPLDEMVAEIVEAMPDVKK